MKHLIVISLVLILGASCSPQKRLNRKINRVERFAKKHNLIVTDTITVSDTVVTEDLRVDTILKDTTFFRLLRDTLTVNNDRLTIREYYYNNTDSIIIEGECLGDTIVREIKVPIESPVKTVEKEKIPLWIWLLLSLSAIISILALRKR